MNKINKELALVREFLEKFGVEGDILEKVGENHVVIFLKYVGWETLVIPPWLGKYIMFSEHAKSPLLVERPPRMRTVSYE